MNNPGPELTDYAKQVETEVLKATPIQE